MKNKKRFIALGLTVAMAASMSIGAFAATPDQVLNQRTAGDNTPANAEASVDVDGWLTKDAVIDSNGSSVNPSLPSYTGSGKPLDSNSSSTDWGGDGTEDSAQLIITAPTYLSFLVAGDGTDANIQLTSSDKSVKGTILNQSCYIQSSKVPVPKTVSVAVTKANATGDFKVVSGINAAEDSNQVAGVYLNLKGGTAQDLGANLNKAALGTLAAGTRAAGDAVNPSSTDLFFADQNGTAAGVTTKFASSYEDGKELKSNFKLNMVYNYNK